MLDKKSNKNKKRDWCKQHISDKPIQHFPIRDAISKWEDKNGVEFGRALKNK